MGVAALLPRSYDMIASTSRRLLAPRTVERSLKRVLISVPALFPSGMEVNSLFLCKHTARGHGGSQTMHSLITSRTSYTSDSS